MRHSRFRFALTALVAVMLLLVSGGAYAEPTITVTSTADSGNGTLRKAITDIPAGGTIKIDVGDPIILTSSQLTISKNITITTKDGLARTIQRDSNASQFRIFRIEKGTTVTLRNLNITGGNISGVGGGIFNSGTLTLRNCSVYQNTSSKSGGGIFNNVAPAKLTMVNCTVSTNDSNGNGGGICNIEFGEMNLYNCTVVGNRVFVDGIGGNIFTEYNDIPRVTVENSIIVGGYAQSGTDQDLSTGKFISNGYNIVGELGSATGFGTGELGSTASDVVQLGFPVDNGNGAMTHALVANSPAIDSGDPDFDSEAFNPPLNFDQRGNPFFRVVNGQVDVGALESDNLAPTFTSTEITTGMVGVTYSYDITTSDPDLPDDTLAITAVTKPDWLTLVDYGDTTALLTGTPAATGDYLVELQVTDQMGATDTQTFTITVSEAPNPPIANPDSYDGTQGQPLEVTAAADGVLANDTDSDGATSLLDVAGATAEVVTGVDAAEGTLNFNPDGTFTFTPADGFAETEVQFTYRANDGTSDSNETTVTLNFTTTNHAPVLDNSGEMSLTAISSTISDGENTGTLISDIIASSTVADPITDEDGDPEGIAIFLTDAPNGTWQYDDGGTFTDFPEVSETNALLLNDNVTVRFMPGPDFVVGDTTPQIYFYAWDRTSGTNGGQMDASTRGGATAFSENSETASIAVTAGEVTALNDDYTLNLAEGASLVVAAPGILEDDIGTNLTVKSHSDPAAGTLEMTATDGSFTYTPNEGTTTDSFTYIATGDEGDSNQATVEITVVNLPVAKDDTLNLDIDTGDQLQISGEDDLLADDLPRSGQTQDSLSIKELITDALAGTLTDNMDGTYTYTAPDGAAIGGEDQFSYTITDGTEDSQEAATVTIKFISGAANNAPVAVNDTYTVTENQTLTVTAENDVLENDTDADDDDLTAVRGNDATDPANGTLDEFNADGSFTYTPNAGFTGQDSFTYQANDGTVDSENEATVTITVQQAGGTTPPPIPSPPSGAPNANFDADSDDFTAEDPYTGVAPLEVEFDDLSTGTVTDWDWELEYAEGEESPEETTRDEENPTYTYEEPGTYTVRLTVSGPNGSDIETKEDYIVVTEPELMADFSADPSTGEAPLEVAFTDESIGEISSWNWDLDGDGETDSTDQNTSYTYEQAGTYTVTLTVSDGENSDSATMTITVEQPEGLMANFTADPTSGTAPLMVNFTDTSSGDVSSWNWDLDGDGETDSTDQNTSYTYNTAGTYTVTLTVSDGEASDSKSTEITVISTGQVDASFTADPLSGIAPLTVNFTDASTGDVSQWLWDFDNGNTSDQPNPSALFAQPGTYEVTLTVSGPSGSDSATGLIRVGDTDQDLVAAFTANPTGGTAPLTVNFNQVSIGDIATWNWDFGDGESSTAPNPSHTYTSVGSFGVTLTVTDVNGAEDTLAVANFINTDETVAGNQLPADPSAVSPADGATEQSLTPALMISPFSDPDGDGHGWTQWQISTSPDFDELVFASTDPKALTSLTVPGLVLEPNTTYYWRASVGDDRGGQSGWSDPVAFTTGPRDDDSDGDGIPDAQALDDSTVDLDGDGVVDTDEADPLYGVVWTPLDQGWMGLMGTENVIGIGRLESMNMDGKPANSNVNMEGGLIGYRLMVPDPTQPATVTVYFSNAAPFSSRWYGYNAVDGWHDYSYMGDASFSESGMSVTLTLEDGGFGDADGVTNGIIVVSASGFGVGPTPPPLPETGEGGGGSDNCFIQTVGTSFGWGGMMILGLSATVGLALRRRN